MRNIHVIDAFKGIAALAVALHAWFALTIHGGGAAVGKAGLGFDALFLLSGFLVAHVYRDSLRDSRSAARFIGFRLARLYPLYAFALIAFVALEGVLQIIWGGSGVAYARPEEEVSLTAFLAGLGLLTGFGLFDTLTWNSPTWAVAVEFWLQILFAALCLGGLLTRALGRVALGLAAFAVTWHLVGVSGGGALWTHDASFGFARGFVAFTLGALSHSVMATDRAHEALSAVKRRAASLVELGAFAGLVAFFAFAGPQASHAAPYVFAVALIAFLGAERGVVSRVLEGWAPQGLGALAYCIFVTHYLLVRPMEVAVSALGPELGSKVVFAATPAYLILLSALAVWVHRLVEAPTRDVMRDWVDRRIPERRYAALARGI